MATKTRRIQIIALVGIGAAVIALAGWSQDGNIFRGRNEQSVSPNVANNEPVRTISDGSVASEASPPITGGDAQGWLEFDSSPYTFRLMYPPTFTVSRSCDIMSASLISGMGTCLGNITSTRVPSPAEQELATVVVTVYDNNERLSLSSWLRQNVPGAAGLVPPGTISKALAAAYGQPRATRTLTTISEKNIAQLSRIEVGAVIGGALSYTTFLAPSTSPYIYSLELYLQEDPLAQNPTDEEYLNIYNQIVSSTWVD